VNHHLREIVGHLGCDLSAATGRACRLRGRPLRDGEHHLKALLAAFAHERVRRHRLPPGAAISLRVPSEERLDLTLLGSLSRSRDQPSDPGQNYQYGLHEFSHCSCSLAPSNRPPVSGRSRAHKRAQPPSASSIRAFSCHEGIQLTRAHQRSPRPGAFEAPVHTQQGTLLALHLDQFVGRGHFNELGHRSLLLSALHRRRPLRGRPARGRCLLCGGLRRAGGERVPAPH
jgi:hypothetical protein